jgi:Fe-Mn family superoxide dismutase
MERGADSKKVWENLFPTHLCFVCASRKEIAMKQPQSLSRRQVVQTASLLGISSLALTVSQDAHAQGGDMFKESGLRTHNPKPLKYEAIPGLLTKEQIAPHYRAHYGGALKRYVKIESDLDALLAGKSPLASDAFTFMQKDKLNRMNSVLLHELYFDNLTPTPPALVEDIRTALAKRFGSFERWQEDFRAVCMAASGWGILARDMVNGKLYNVASDSHEVGVLWLGQPLLVCDVYEHAFYVDYQNRKQEYVDKFLTYVDWNTIDQRYKALNGSS